MKKGVPLDVALMITTEELQPQLKLFRDDHASAFSLGPKHYLAVLVVFLIFLGACVLLWDAGLGR